MPGCKVCGKGFDSGAECFTHQEKCVGDVICKELNLAKASMDDEVGLNIAQTLAIMRKNHPGVVFQVVPISYNQYGNITGALIIG